jgi:catechol 2,3-dioxygenase-like lactoylglutathione lyase family enzyme
MLGVTGLGEVVLNVRDMERSLAFYRDLLGLAVISPPEMRSPVFLRAGDAAPGIPAMIVLVQLGPEAPPFGSPRPLHHLAVTVGEGTLPEAERVLLGGGLDVRHGQHPVLKLPSLYVFDPDGNEVEVISPAPPEGPNP